MKEELAGLYGGGKGGWGFGEVGRWGDGQLGLRDITRDISYKESIEAYFRYA